MKNPLEVKNYYDLFTRDNLKADYFALMKVYHPDKYKGPDASKICAKINSFYEEAKDHLAKGTWGDDSNVIYLTSKQTTRRIKYLYSGANECGEYYIGNTIVVYSFTQKKFFENYLKAVKSIHFADNKLKEYYQRFLPEIMTTFETDDHKYYIVLKKTADVYPLELVKDIFKQKEHAAWLSTRLFNLSAFLNTTNLVHNGFSMNNIFVSLEHHGASILGGWQYAVEEGTKMIGTNNQVYSVMTPSVKSSKLANYSTDTLSIKNLICAVLGGNIYRELVGIVGEPWANFLLQGGEAHPFDVVNRWEYVRDISFTEHRFVKVDIPENVYTK